MVLPQGNTTVLATAVTKMGVQIVATGADQQLYHKYQFPNGTFSLWHRITNNMSRAFDSDPAVAVNADGRLEVFVRYHTNLDMWQTYQKDASDPTSWSTIRESSCVDLAGCIPLGNTTDTPDFWNHQPVFPTSNPQVAIAPNGAIQMYYRGFDGAYYFVQQETPGASIKYSRPQRLDTILE